MPKEVVNESHLVIRNRITESSGDSNRAATPKNH